MIKAHREFRKQLQRAGVNVLSMTMSGKHLCCRFLDAAGQPRVYFASATPSDCRGYLNAKRAILRIIASPHVSLEVPHDGSA